MITLSKLRNSVHQSCGFLDL